MLETDQVGLDDIVKYIAGLGRGIVEHARRLEDLQQQVDARFAALENLIGKTVDSVQRLGSELSDKTDSVSHEVAGVIVDGAKATASSVSTAARDLSDAVGKTEKRTIEEVSHLINGVDKSMSARAADLSSSVDNVRTVLSRAIDESGQKIRAEIADRVSRAHSGVQMQLDALAKQGSSAHSDAVRQLQTQADRVNREVYASAANLKSEMSRMMDDIDHRFQALSTTQDQLLDNLNDMSTEVRRRLESLTKCMYALALVTVLAAGGLAYLIMRRI